MHEAILYKIEGNRIRCNLCRHHCLIEEGKTGLCNVRQVQNRKLFSLFYGKPISIAIDPIEKKPLFHYRPGTTSLSIATPGCNFQCDFCQNWEISQYGRDGVNIIPSKEASPESIVGMAIENKCSSISYTYTEPTIFMEYALDTGKLAKGHKLGNVFVTNGYMTREAIDLISPYLNAANVDLKAFRKETYKKVMKANLDGVLDSIIYMKEKGIWLEITTLIVPEMNDDDAEIRDIAKFIAKTGIEIPWHISRFIPQYNRNETRPTPYETLKRAYDIGKEEGLRYVYLGNVRGDKSESTFCYNCNEIIIERNGYEVISINLDSEGRCKKCLTPFDGIL